MPAEVFQALVALSLCWGWTDMALLICIGFLGMLRPGELVSLTSSDLAFVTLHGARVCFVRIRYPKMRRTGPRREHVRLDDVHLAVVLETWCQTLQAGAALFVGTQLDFSCMLRKLVEHLGLPFKQSWTIFLQSLQYANLS